MMIDVSEADGVPPQRLKAARPFDGRWAATTLRKRPGN
jgi:hypothetical protein